MALIPPAKPLLQGLPPTTFVLEDEEGQVVGRLTASFIIYQLACDKPAVHLMDLEKGLEPSVLNNNYCYPKLITLSTADISVSAFHTFFQFLNGLFVELLPLTLEEYCDLLHASDFFGLKPEFANPLSDLGIFENSSGHLPLTYLDLLGTLYVSYQGLELGLIAQKVVAKLLAKLAYVDIIARLHELPAPLFLSNKGRNKICNALRWFYRQNEKFDRANKITRTESLFERLIKLHEETSDYPITTKGLQTIISSVNYSCLFSPEFPLLDQLKELYPDIVDPRSFKSAVIGKKKKQKKNAKLRRNNAKPRKHKISDYPKALALRRPSAD